MKTLTAIHSTTTSAATPPPSALPSWSAVLNPQINATATMITASTVMTTQNIHSSCLSYREEAFRSLRMESRDSGEGDDRGDADHERHGPGEPLCDRAFLFDRA